MHKKIAGLAILVAVLSLVSCKPTFKKLPSGLEIMTVKKGEGKRTGKEGDYFAMHLITKINDSVLFRSSEAQNGKPMKGKVQKAAYTGDPMECFYHMHEGDSAIVRVRIDSSMIDKMMGAKVGDTLQLEIRLVSLKSEQEMEKEAKEYESKNDKEIQDYLKKNNINAQKTPSGLYYVITQPGTGPNATNGQEASIMYTGQLTDGTLFDSNVDPKFQHSDPIPVQVGAGGVIPGWDEGLTYLNKGAKAKFFIPSQLAYRGQELPGGPANPKGIPSYSVLVFDIEVKDIKAGAPQAPATMNPADIKVQ
jgi:FKBP-type peptidyl-prolyl cis-trans isomerase FkpA